MDAIKHEPMGAATAPMRYSLESLAKELGGRCEGDPALTIGGVAGIREAEPGQISFLANARYLPYLGQTRASAMIVGEDIDVNGLPAIRVANPYLSFLQTVHLFSSPLRESYPAGRSELAVVGEDSVLGEGCHLGAFVHVGKGCRIGAEVILMPGAVVLDRVSIGDGSILFPNVVVREDCRLGKHVIVHAGTVIGSDGFGYAKDGERYSKVPQIGRVEIGDDVEIGANVTVDRATTSVTRIGRGTKIDNLVQVAHNAVIGENSIVVAQVGISGSTRIGDGVTIGGQAGIIGHIEVGNGATIGAQAGVTKSVDAGVCVSGYPARPHEQSMRMHAAAARLPELMKSLKRLEAELADLKRSLSETKEGSE